jgi:hypothetical protein
MPNEKNKTTPSSSEEPPFDAGSDRPWDANVCDWKHYSMSRAFEKLLNRQSRLEELLEEKLQSVGVELSKLNNLQESKVRGQQDHIRRLEEKQFVGRKVDGHKLPGPVALGLTYASMVVEQMIAQGYRPQDAIEKLKKMAGDVKL